MLTPKTARSRLSYDSDTGILRWRKSTGRAAGSIAGTLHNNGTIKVQLCGRCYLAHRLIWFIHFGQWPDGDVVHLNHNRIDNRLVNLVVASKADASRYRRRRMTGVSMAGSRYRARIKANGKEVHLGCFGTAAEAHAAYERAVEELCAT